MAELDCKSFTSLKEGAGTLHPDSPGLLGSVLQDRRLEDGTVLRPEVRLAPVDPVDHLVEATVTISWTAGRRSKKQRLVRRFSSVLR